MTRVALPNKRDIEESLLPFRICRSLVLEGVLQWIASAGCVSDPFLMLSRLFARVKSADSILEKLQRKGIAISDVSELPERLPDVLGFRIITDSVAELIAVKTFLGDTFEIVSLRDQMRQPGELGDRGVECSLRLHLDGVTYPFEIQLRTFLQHYWASRSFHLFHKKSKETALSHRDDLLRFSQLLAVAEEAEVGLSEETAALRRRDTYDWNDLPLRSQTNLVVVEQGEHFRDRVILTLTGNHQIDHNAIVRSKLKLYEAYSGSAVVECSCLNLVSFLLNEPLVRIPLDRLKEAAL